MANDLILDPVSRPHLVNTSSTDGSVRFQNAAGTNLLVLSPTGVLSNSVQATSGTPSTTGGLLNYATVTYTDSATAMSGTATAFAAYAIQAPTLAATNTSVTTTDAATLYLSAAPIAGTNETLTNAWALWVDAGAVRLDGNLSLRGAYLHAPVAASGTPAASAGSIFNVATSTFTDSATAMSGTATAFAAYSFNAPTLAATNTSVTTTNAATVYIDAAVIAGTNETLTNALALWVDAGITRLDGTLSFVATASTTIICGTAETLFRNNSNSATLLKFTNEGQFTLGPGAASGTPGTSGSYFNLTTATFTDNNTAMSGTAAAFVSNAFKAPTLAATNTSVTTTDAATLYIDAAPIAGTNQTITNPLSIWADAGDVRFDANIWTGGEAAFATTQPTMSHVFLGTGTAPVGAIVNSSAIYASTTVMRKINAAGTDSAIEA